MIDQEELVKRTIFSPTSVRETSDPARRLFRGATITTGFWKGSFPKVLLRYTKNGVGFLLTAYLDTLEPRGKKNMAIRVGKLWVDYDDSADVLYLSIGEPRPAVTHEDEDDDNLLIRKDPQTGETVGVTILEYYNRFRLLPDLSWLATRGLPPEVLRYLEDRPIL
jgi:uncharacterized protein YuzE